MIPHCVIVAHGESSVVRAWHLRPSLVWKDGEWIDSSSLHGNVCTSHEVLSIDVLRLDVCSVVSKGFSMPFVFVFFSPY